VSPVDNQSQLFFPNVATTERSYDQLLVDVSRFRNYLINLGGRLQKTYAYRTIGKNFPAIEAAAKCCYPAVQPFSRQLKKLFDDNPHWGICSVDPPYHLPPGVFRYDMCYFEVGPVRGRW
jgi:hypothetical protein